MADGGDSDVHSKGVAKAPFINSVLGSYTKRITVTAQKAVKVLSGHGGTGPPLRLAVQAIEEQLKAASAFRIFFLMP